MHVRVSYESQCGLYQRTNKANCLLENKMVSTLIWRHIRLLYAVQSSETFYGLLFSYLTITDVTDRTYIINSQFLSCCTSQPN